MKTITETFPNGIDDIQRYVPDIPSSMYFDGLTASFTNAYLRIANVIGDTFLDACIDHSEDLLKNLTLGALANYTMFEQSPFLHKGKNDLYRYQFIEIQDKYISNAWSFLDALIKALDASTVADWKEGDCYKNRQNLVFKSQNDFNNYYAINNSAYFFSKIVFLIREESNKFIPKRITLVKLEEKASLAEKLKFYIAYRVMSRAVMQFEVSELTKSLRHDINHEFTKYGNLGDGDNKTKLSKYLSGVADDYSAQLEIEFSKLAGTFANGDIENPNREDKKYYFMR
jgi:hypothetical protein